MSQLHYVEDKYDGRIYFSGERARELYFGFGQTVSFKIPPSGNIIDHKWCEGDGKRLIKEAGFHIHSNPMNKKQAVLHEEMQKKIATAQLATSITLPPIAKDNNEKEKKETKDNPVPEVKETDKPPVENKQDQKN